MKRSAWERRQTNGGRRTQNIHDMQGKGGTTESRKGQFRRAGRWQREPTQIKYSENTIRKTFTSHVSLNCF